MIEIIGLLIGILFLIYLANSLFIWIGEPGRAFRQFKKDYKAGLVRVRFIKVGACNTRFETSSKRGITRSSLNPTIGIFGWYYDRECTWDISEKSKAYFLSSVHDYLLKERLSQTA